MSEPIKVGDFVRHKVSGEYGYVYEINGTEPHSTAFISAGFGAPGTCVCAPLAALEVVQTIPPKLQGGMRLL